MQEKMKSGRYLCSDLFRMRGTGGWSGWANLEEIWSDGAILESETPIPLGQKLLLRKDGGKIWATVDSCEAHEFGYRVDLSFLFGYCWTPDVFRPEHLLDLDKIPRPDS